MAMFIALVALAIACLVEPSQAKLGPRPYIIGHRGASGLRPEHTLEGYQLAIDQGADFIECDVVATKDCHLICRHEPDVNMTTNAGKLFPSLLKTTNIDGNPVTGILAADLTMAQVSQLRARQSRDFRDQQYNDQFKIPTLDEYLALAQSQKRTVGVYPETKHPSWHDMKLKCFKEGSFTKAVLKALERRGYAGPINSPEWNAKPVFLQSFEANNIKALSKETKIPMVQLLDEWNLKVPYDNRTYYSMTTAEGLKEIATYAAGIGPWKGSFVVTNSKNVIDKVDEAFVKRAKAAGLQMHPYTFRNENQFLAFNYQCDIHQEYDRFFKHLKVDGVFTDFSGTLHRYMEDNKV